MPHFYACVGKCTGDELAIEKCPGWEIGPALGCDHSQDVNIKCIRGEKQMIRYIVNSKF